MQVRTAGSTGRGGSACAIWFAVLAGLPLMACGRTASDGQLGGASALPEPASRLDGKIRWAAYDAMDGEKPRSFVVDFTDFRSPVQIPITEPGQLAEGEAFSPDGSRLAFGIVERQAMSTSPFGDVAPIPAVVSLWLVGAPRSFEVKQLDVERKLPWAKAIYWVDERTLLIHEGTGNRYYALDVDSGQTTELGTTQLEARSAGPWLAGGKVVFTETPCHFVYWDPSLTHGFELPGVGSCAEHDLYGVQWSPDGAYLAAVRPGGVSLFATPSGVPQALALDLPTASASGARTVFEWAPDSRRFFMTHVSAATNGASFSVGDVVSQTFTEHASTRPVDYGRFATPDVLLLDDWQAASSQVLQLTPDDAIQSSAQLEHAAPYWDLGDRDLSSNGRVLYYHPPFVEEQALYRVALEPEHELLPERLPSVVPKASTIFYLDSFDEDAWLLYLTLGNEPEGGTNDQRFLLDLSSGKPATSVLSFSQLEGLSYQALHRELPEPGVALLQAGSDYQSKVFWLSLTSPRAPTTMFQFLGAVPTPLLQLPPRWPDALGPP